MIDVNFALSSSVSRERADPSLTLNVVSANQYGVPMQIALNAVGRFVAGTVCLIPMLARVTRQQKVQRADTARCADKVQVVVCRGISEASLTDCDFPGQKRHVHGLWRLCSLTIRASNNVVVVLG
jgi:hypothetical protein